MLVAPVNRPVQPIEDWYTRLVRPFLERIEKIDLKSGRIEDFDAELARFRQASVSYDGDLVVCFLGLAGVGKSTLINALVDGRRGTLPHGGIGPLTAQAMSVRRGEAPGLHVTYQPRGQLWKLVKALEWGFKKELPGKLDASELNQTIESDATNPLTEEDDQDLRALAQTDEPHTRTRVQSYRQQAQLLVKGDQNTEAEITYLIDALNTALGKSPRWATELVEADADRVGRIREALEDGRYDCNRPAFDHRFHEDLKSHATGYLAPLIKEMSVTCPSETLPEGVVLVDLPGLGVAGDIHKEVTSRWLRENARSVILVVNHRGIQDADAQLLQESGFLNRLIYSADNPAEDPVSLAVAVVRVDEIALTRWRDARIALHAGETLRKKQDYFVEACEEARGLILSQLKQQLEKAWASGDLQDAQSQVIENLLANLEVHPVSAVEYAKCQLGEPDDQSFLSEPDLSNVPSLLDSMRHQVRLRRESELRRVDEARLAFLSRLDATLNVIQAQWMEDARAAEEAERLREEFLDFIEPLRGEFRSRQGAYREFLRETLPRTIQAEIGKASTVAQKEILAYLKPLEAVGYKTLQATVQRGGTFVTGVSRKIDLPHDFALRFEVPVADAWAKCVLKEIRRRTKEFAEDCVRLVDNVVVWAKAQGARVQPRLVEAQRDSIKADAKALETIGRIMIDQLRKEINSRLVRKIETPIRRRCRAFVENGQAQGQGVKQNILKLFTSLAHEVTDAAVGPTEMILLETFQDVEKEILAVLGRNPDPLDSARDAIIEAHENYVKRSDAQRRRQILADIETILEERLELVSENNQVLIV